MREQSGRSRLSSKIWNAPAIFHLAAQVAMTTLLIDLRDDFTTKAFGTFNVLEAALQFKPLPTVLYTSTSKVHGKIEPVRVAERGTRMSLAAVAQFLFVA